MDSKVNQTDQEYNQVLTWLFKQLPVFQRVGNQAYKADLDRTLALDEYFGHPHKTYKTIHVAGTNGKGSVSHMLASVLQEAGYMAGLYTSPHLKDFRERIRMNGVPVPKEFVIRFTEENKGLFEELKPSFFEMTVAMAFEYFRYAEVDIAVIETGLGGRLDSTNIILPEISIITNIGHDHSEFLGSNLKKVAREKAGIIKPGIPVVIGETQEGIKDVFGEVAAELDSELVFADQKYQVEYSLMTLENKQKIKFRDSGNFGFDEIKTDLLGLYQTKNVATSLMAIEKMQEKGIHIEGEAILSGLERVIENTGLMGRWQLLGTDPLIVCDTAHNKEGLREVMRQIRDTAFRTLHFVLGVVKEKNLKTILKLLPKEAVYYFVKADILRALDAGILAEEAAKAGLQGTVFSNVRSAFEKAKQNAKKEDMIFVGGSTFVVAEVL